MVSLGAWQGRDKGQYMTAEHLKGEPGRGDGWSTGRKRWPAGWLGIYNKPRTFVRSGARGEEVRGRDGGALAGDGRGGSVINHCFFTRLTVVTVHIRCVRRSSRPERTADIKKQKNRGTYFIDWMAWSGLAWSGSCQQRLTAQTVAYTPRERDSHRVNPQIEGGTLVYTLEAYTSL